MALKRIEINGFKSFADKTEILLSPGVTVIVGPNGSGKSNVSDAIRWVLGEQSPRTLRGTKMEDVIFAGSDRRKSVGMAEVSITLDNDKGTLPVDFREVTVTRRVFRSGDSDYLLNRSHCRLKDLHELFSDTGLGRDGISIIGQGRVDEVLSSRPEDRRALIEEAAGIIRYRNRKREAAKKLEETQQHIIRLGDIIEELENQQGPLADQAERARRYKEVELELQQLELGLLVLDWGEMDYKISQVKKDVEKASANLWEKEARLAALEASETAESLKNRQAEEEVMASRQRVHQQTEQVIAVEGRLNVARERLKGLNAQIELLRKELEQNRSAFSEINLRVMEHQKRHENVASELELARDEAAKRTTQGSLARESVDAAETEIQDLRQRLFAKAQHLAKVRTQVHDVELRVTRQEIYLKRLEDELSQASSRVSDLEGEVAHHCSREEQTQNQLNIVQTELAKINDEIHFVDGQTSDLENKLSQTIRRWQEVSARKKALEVMEKSHEGYASGVREVLSQLEANNPKIAGIYGVIGELLEVPNGLEIALDVALGGGMQNLVVEDDDAARRGIEHLKSTKKGRATFLPLKSLQVPIGPAKELLNQSGVVGCAADLVKTQAKYTPAIRFLLGRTLVVENLAVALQVARQTRYQWRVVTLEGELLQPGGSVSGGSLGQRGGQTFMRRRELTLLAEEESSLGIAVTGLKQRRKDLAEQHSRLTQCYKEMEKRVSELHLEKAGRDAELARVRRSLEQERLVIEGRYSEIGIIQEELKQSNAEKSHLNEQLHQVEAENREMEQELLRRQEQLTDLRSVDEEGRDELIRWQLRCARLEEEVKGLLEALSSLKEEKRKLENDINAKDVDCVSIEESIVRCQEEIRQLEVTLVEQMAAEETLTQEVIACQHRQEEVQQRLKELVEERKSSVLEVNDLRNLLHQLEIKLARLEAESETITERLKENWNLSPSQAQAEVTPPADRKAAQKALNAAREIIRELGPVNLLAIEEEERLLERLTFLQQQHHDLMTAKEALQQVIREMEEIMVRRFGQAFDEINRQFGQVFTELFQGGQAELVLTNPEELLETGVDIVAQPPGKKPVYLSLLSGGERALTAIALLFALLKVRPSPFCVLDEIEASLDEANVTRFAKYLQVLAEKSQFIVISHRKGTMEAADHLYGVTMEESGVSKLISVKLTQPESAAG